MVIVVMVVTMMVLVVLVVLVVVVVVVVVVLLLLLLLLLLLSEGTERPTLFISFLDISPSHLSFFSSESTNERKPCMMTVDIFFLFLIFSYKVDRIIIIIGISIISIILTISNECGWMDGWMS